MQLWHTFAGQHHLRLATWSYTCWCWSHLQIFLGSKHLEPPSRCILYGSRGATTSSKSQPSTRPNSLQWWVRQSLDSWRQGAKILLGLQRMVQLEMSAWSCREPGRIPVAADGETPIHSRNHFKGGFPTHRTWWKEAFCHREHQVCISSQGPHGSTCTWGFSSRPLDACIPAWRGEGRWVVGLAWVQVSHTHWHI